MGLVLLAETNILFEKTLEAFIEDNSTFFFFSIIVLDMQ